MQIDSDDAPASRIGEETFRLDLTEKEIQALFRAAIDYRRLLEFSALKDSTLVGAEMSHIDSVSEKISLSFHFPIRQYAGDWD